MEDINKFLEEHCDTKAVLDSKDFPWSKEFRKNWRKILEEFENYSLKHAIPNYSDIDPNLSGETKGWKSLFLRAFNNDTEVMKEFPFTKNLLDHPGVNCTTAYFSALEPGTHIPEHKGVYKGVIRYHLALKVPQDNANCFIVVNDHKLFWEEGKDIMFDDMYLHHVENNTDERRIVLFLDIKRNFKNSKLDHINNMNLECVKETSEVQSIVNMSNLLNKPV